MTHCDNCQAEMPADYGLCEDCMVTAQGELDDEAIQEGICGLEFYRCGLGGCFLCGVAEDTLESLGLRMGPEGLLP